MKFLESTIRRLDALHDVVLAQLHPVLRERANAFMLEMNGRLALYTGFRDQHDQEVAFHTGASAAHWLDSPHNFALPLGALAFDAVLNPRFTDCGPHPDDADFPWLWNDKSPDCLAVWQRAELAAITCGLERVDVNGKRDRPHFQLPNWRAIVAEQHK